MYKIKISAKAKKDLKKLKKTSIKDFEQTKVFIKDLANKGFSNVDAKYKPHKLKGNYKGFFECHIKPDLLLIWLEGKEKENEIEIDIVDITRVGTHSELF